MMNLRNQLQRVSISEIIDRLKELEKESPETEFMYDEVTYDGGLEFTCSLQLEIQVTKIVTELKTTGVEINE